MKQLLSILFVVSLITYSCSDACKDVVCENGAICEEGICECLKGYNGTFCEAIDTNEIQHLLDNGLTPSDLYQNGVTIEQLYGNRYLDGIIFYYNPTDGTGMVSTEADVSAAAAWGCRENNIQAIMDVTDCSEDCFQPEPLDQLEGARLGDGLDNTNAILNECEQDEIAALLCRELGTEWHLPSRTELDLLYKNMFRKGHGIFNFNGVNSGWYWTSTERNESAWFIAFTTGNHSLATKDFELYVRGVRWF